MIIFIFHFLQWTCINDTMYLYFEWYLRYVANNQTCKDSFYGRRWGGGDKINMMCKKEGIHLFVRSSGSYSKWEEARIKLLFFNLAQFWIPDQNQLLTSHDIFYLDWTLFSRIEGKVHVFAHLVQYMAQAWGPNETFIGSYVRSTK